MYKAFHHYMLKEHKAGIFILQRGLTYYITRVSNIRGTAGYEQYTSCLWHVDATADMSDNPAISYKLYGSRWGDWQAVKHTL